MANTEPNFIYGTAWKEERTKQLTELALQTGFRAIDTANQRKHYFEAAVGEAIRDAIDSGQVAREDLFLQTKFTHLAGQDERLPYDPDAPVSRQVRQSCDSSLEHLGIAHIDSYVLHGPSTRVGLADQDVEAWRAMEELYEDDKVRALGASNVSADQLRALIDTSEHPIAWVQNRCFARDRWDAEVRAVCDDNDITYQGFSLLTANARELSVEEVAEIARRHDATLPQVVFRFAMQLGIVPLTGTGDAKHMEEDLACDGFDLSDDEMKTMLDLVEN